MKRLSDSEFLEVLPQFLGISFALVVFALWKGHVELLYAAGVLLFLLILRAPVLLLVGRVLHSVIREAGRLFTAGVLAIMYTTLVSLYAMLYRVLSPETANKFLKGVGKETNFVDVIKKYEKVDFEKTW